MAENHRFALPPVLVEDLGAVTCGDRAHQHPPRACRPQPHTPLHDQADPGDGTNLDGSTITPRRRVWGHRDGQSSFRERAYILDRSPFREELMRLLRRLSTRQLIALTATIIAVAAGATAIATAASNGGPKPDPKPLPVAVHDALTAPEVQGVSARIQFTNHLIDSSSVQGSDPILTGASGRRWASNDGHLRLELQASGNEGATSDTEVLADRKQVTVYDSGTNTVYRADLPAANDATDQTKSDGPPSLAQVRN